MSRACAALILACACGGGSPPPPAAAPPQPPPPSPARLRFVSQPESAVAGQPFEASVQIEDANARPVDFAGEVGLELITSPGAPAKLAGPVRAVAVHGTATFSGLTIDAEAAAVALRASSALLSATSSVFAVAAAAGAAPSTWHRTGFTGGAILALTSVPEVRGALFAATPRGIFRSRDGARSWSRCEMVGAPGQAANGLLAVSERRLWASFGRRGLWISDDGCATWAESNGGVEKPSYGYEFFRLENHAGHVYASSLLSGVFRRDDAADRWVRLAEPAGARDSFIGFASAPSDPQVAYAYGYGHKLYGSSDGGLSWPRHAGSGFEAFEPTGAIAVHPADPQTALVVDGRIYRTQDGAATLSPVSVFGVRQIFFDPVDGDFAYASVNVSLDSAALLRSSDAGRTWAPADAGIRLAGISTTVLALDGAEPGILYLGVSQSLSAGTVYRSPARATSWERASSGIDAAGVSSIAASGAKTWLATSDGSVYGRDGERGSWRELGSTDPILSLAVDPANPAVLLAGTSRGVARSEDGGSTWTRGSGGDTPSVWLHPAVRGLALAGGVGVERSTDGGVTWKRASAPNALFLGFAADLVSGRLFASATSTRVAGGFFISDDQGATWTSVPGPAGVLVADGAPHPVLYVVTQGGEIDRSTDEGATWTRVLDASRPTVLAVSGPGRRPLYAVRSATCTDFSGLITACGAAGGEVLRSDDEGDTWSPLQDPFSAEFTTSVFVSPTNPAHVFVGTLLGGLFESLEAGR